MDETRPQIHRFLAVAARFKDSRQNRTRRVFRSGCELRKPRFSFHLPIMFEPVIDQGVVVLDFLITGFFSEKYCNLEYNLIIYRV
jgi:hypothetical protein